MGRLQAKASKGTLTNVEKDELAEYLRVDDMLALLQAKARNSLRRVGVES